MRLDQAIAERNPDISRRKARELISARRVLVNDRPVGIASREIATADRIVIVDELPSIAILREGSDWIAVDKPSGMAVQPVRDRARRSLEELLRLQLRGELYLVHRIDTGTSGVVLFARTRDAAARLSELFAKRLVQKTYLAVVEGEIAEELTIETPIAEREAVTIIRPRASADGLTCIEAEIRTGRTHQIRIHLQSIAHPVAGDRRYGSTVNAPRLMLHAWRIEHESFGVLEASAPDDLIRCPPLWTSR
ncbi:MAG: pseudouridine synthase [Acidobacteria bacterium]|nr:pseudouridine synthase [Acidobacteriota bacterium]